MSPRTPKQFESIREEKMTLIMDTALQHFAAEGFHSTTISHIARHAGISKGLMYNYFSSKEELLGALINRSVYEIYNSFDINRDGFLTEDEFEYFIRQTAKILIEKKNIWRLFFQLLMQNDVREQFIRSFPGKETLPGRTETEQNEFFVAKIMKTISDYFIRKKERRGTDYDPFTDMNMFVLTLKGFALTFVYIEETDKLFLEETVNKIIETYK